MGGVTVRRPTIATRCRQIAGSSGAREASDAKATRIATPLDPPHLLESLTPPALVACDDSVWFGIRHHLVRIDDQTSTM